MNKLFITSALLIATLTTSCTHRISDQEESHPMQQHAEPTDSTAIDLTTIAGTYEGTATTPGRRELKTTLTLNADSTYHLRQEYTDSSKEKRDEASGTLQLGSDSTILLTRPSNGLQCVVKVLSTDSVQLNKWKTNAADSSSDKSLILKR